MEIWHARIGHFGRAFVTRPTDLRVRLALYVRGWRKHNHLWWGKPSSNQRLMERLRSNA